MKASQLATVLVLSMVMVGAFASPVLATDVDNISAQMALLTTTLIALIVAIIPILIILSVMTYVLHSIKLKD